MFMDNMEQRLRAQSNQEQTRVLCHRVIRRVRVIDTACGAGVLLDGGPDR